MENIFLQGSQGGGAYYETQSRQIEGTLTVRDTASALARQLVGNAVSIERVVLVNEPRIFWRPKSESHHQTKQPL